MFYWGNTKERDHLEDLGISRTIIIKWILQKYDRSSWTLFIRLRKGNVARCCEHGDEILGPIKCRELVAYLKNYHLFHAGRRLTTNLPAVYGFVNLAAQLSGDRDRRSVFATWLQENNLNV